MMFSKSLLPILSKIINVLPFYTTQLHVWNRMPILLLLVDCCRQQWICPAFSAWLFSYDHWA